jgi:hypothetical protein
MAFLAGAVSLFSASAIAAPLCAQAGALSVHLDFPKDLHQGAQPLLALTFSRLPQHARITVSSVGQFVGSITNFGGRSTGKYSLSLPLLESGARSVDIDLHSQPPRPGLPVQSFCLDDAQLRSASDSVGESAPGR